MLRDDVGRGADNVRKGAEVRNSGSFAYALSIKNAPTVTRFARMIEGSCFDLRGH